MNPAIKMEPIAASLGHFPIPTLPPYIRDLFKADNQQNGSKTAIP
jgi:hypothetical protein